jgi:membrane-bound lytic murein transglycosylase D
VKKGDTLDALAKRFNVSTRVLSAWNKLKNRIALKPGHRIIIAKFTEKNGAMASSAEKS